MSCTCQHCGGRYRVDLIVPDHIWEKIKPPGKPEGAGLLCGVCIMKKIEDFGEYGAIHMETKYKELNVVTFLKNKYLRYLENRLLKSDNG